MPAGDDKLRFDRGAVPAVPAAVMDRARPFLPCCRCAAALLAGKIAWPASSSRCSRHWENPPPGPGRGHPGQLFPRTAWMGPILLLWRPLQPRWPHPPEPCQFLALRRSRLKNGRALYVVIDQAAPASTNPLLLTSAETSRPSALERRPMTARPTWRPRRGLQQAQLRAHGPQSAEGAPKSCEQAADPPLQPPFQQRKRANAGRRLHQRRSAETRPGQAGSLANDRGLRFAPPPWSFRCTPGLAERLGGDNPGGGGLAQDDSTGPLQQALEAASARSGAPCWSSAASRAKPAMFSLHPCWAQAPGQLIVVGLGEAAGWRCRAVCAVARCSDRQGQGSL